MTIRFDYTIVDNPVEPERTPEGFIAIDDCGDGEDPVRRVADVYGTDEAALQVAQAVLLHLRQATGGSVALIFPEGELR